MSEQTAELVQLVGLWLIRLLVPLLLGYVAQQVKRWMDRQAEDAFFWKLKEVVKTAVVAAEQLGLTGQLSEFAESKLQYAIDYVERWLAAQGVPLDLDQYEDVIRGMIERTVRECFPSKGAGSEVKPLNGYSWDFLSDPEHRF